jgi:hypothetical protein
LCGTFPWPSGITPSECLPSPKFAIETGETWLKQSKIPPGVIPRRTSGNRDPLAHATQFRLPWLRYHGTLVQMTDDSKLLVERVQTGVRIEKRILKVLKAFGEYHDMTLGDVLEGIVLHAFDGKTPFSPASLERIRELKKFYGLDLDSSASHRLKEIKARSSRKRTSEK